MAASDGCFLLETVLGKIGLAWTGRGIDAVELPGPDEESTRRRLAERVPGRSERTTVPAPVRSTARRIRRHLDDFQRTE